MSHHRELGQSEVSRSEKAQREEIELECAKKLRALRRRRGLTLEECEITSGGKFKAVVLGSYERGARAISLSRLSQLADFYEVSIDYFLSTGGDPLADKSRWVFDLRKLREADNSIFPINFLNNALGEIAIERSDWEGEVLSLRKSDNQLFKIIFGEKRDEIIESLQRDKLLRIL